MLKHLTKTQSTMLLLLMFCTVLQLIRVFLTQSLDFSFLLWNIFLAAIPYGLSEIYKAKKIHEKGLFTFSMYILLWLFFLPNAPYIITDFIHFKTDNPMVWFDLFLLFSFANTGLLLAIISIKDIFSIIEYKWSKRIANQCVIAIFFLCGFGIYLGRFLRFNSWDIIASPISLLKKSLVSMLQVEAWATTLGFGTLLWLLFSFVKARKLEERL